MEAELGSDDENHDHLHKAINDSDEGTDEEKIRAEIAEMIDSDEDLDDNIEYLQQKFPATPSAKKPMRQSCACCYGAGHSSRPSLDNWPRARGLYERGKFDAF